MSIEKYVEPLKGHGDGKVYEMRFSCNFVFVHKRIFSGNLTYNIICYNIVL